MHVEPEVEVHLPLAGLIDFAAEQARVEKEIARTEAELQGLRKRLDNAGFVARAPQEVVEKDRARAEELAGKREKLARHLARVTTVEAGMEDKNPQAMPEELGMHRGPPATDQSSGTAGTARPIPEPGGAAQAETSDESLAARTVSRVKSIAQGLMEKLPSVDEVVSKASQARDKAVKKTKSAAAKLKARSAARGAKKARKKAARKTARAKTGSKRKPSSRKGKK